jgi:hypothetical protein
MIGNFHRNVMGTVSFTAKFAGMRKEQDFCVYPLSAGKFEGRLKVQSDTRIGHICTTSGDVTMSKSVSGGAYFHHLALASKIDRLPPDDLLLLKGHVMGSAGGNVGTRGITTDNSAAVEVFEQIDEVTGA